ncbi:MAG: hypothetical protein IJM59_04680 [Proteobacteria bacterium]|nr:hypothetical protein [Pseudomonadota bacterium]
MMKALHYSLAALLAFSVSFPLLACSDDSDTSTRAHKEKEAEPEEDTPNQEEPKKDDETGEDEQKGPEDNVVPEPPKEEPKEGWKAVLMPAMATDVEIANAGFTKLSVMLVSTDRETAGEGISAETIRWGIESGLESASMAVNKSQTNESGVASATINATEVPGAVVVVAASDIAPKTVKFDVTVLDKPKGALSATAVYNGNAPVKNYSIKLYDGDEVQCARLDLPKGPITNWKTGDEANPILDPVNDQSAKFENLSTEMKYTLIAYGYSEAGAPVAIGCLDSGTAVFENQTTESTIYLDTIALDPVTTYHIRSYFDLGNVTAALGTVGSVLSKIDAFARNPGGEVYNYIIDAVKTGIAGWAGILADTALSVTGLKSKLQDYLNDTVKSSQTGCKVGLFVCQFGNVIRQMEFIGSLSVQKEGEVELSGHDNYTGLAVYWRLNCTDDPDPNCGRFAIDTSSITSDEVNLLAGDWNGALANAYDKVSIESHELKLKYGEIVMLLFNGFLIPKLTGDECHGKGSTVDEVTKSSLKCAFGKWINTQSVGDWIADLLNTLSLGLGNVSSSTTKGWVDKGMDALISGLGFASAILNVKDAGSDILISGTAFLKDTNADNVVDDINDGKWTGSMSITTKSGDTSVKTSTAVAGIWSAYNNKNVQTGEGTMYCTTPKTETDSKDQLCHYPAIDLESLVEAGMCNDYKACAK